MSHEELGMIAGYLDCYMVADFLQQVHLIAYASEAESGTCYLKTA